MDNFKDADPKKEESINIEINNDTPSNLIEVWLENDLILIKNNPGPTFEQQSIETLETAYKSLMKCYNYITPTFVDQFFDADVLPILFEHLFINNPTISQGASIILRLYAKKEKSKLDFFIDNEIFEKFIQFFMNSPDTVIISNLLSVFIEIVNNTGIQSTVIKNLGFEILFHVAQKSFDIAIAQEEKSIADTIILRCLIFVGSVIELSNFHDNQYNEIHTMLMQRMDIWESMQNNDIKMFLCWTYSEIVKKFPALEFPEAFYGILILWVNELQVHAIKLAGELIEIDKFPLVQNAEFIVHPLQTATKFEEFVALSKVISILIGKNPFYLDVLFKNRNEIANHMIACSRSQSFDKFKVILSFFASICACGNYVEEIYYIGVFDMLLDAFDESFDDAEICIVAIHQMMCHPNIMNTVLNKLQNHPSIIDDIRDCIDSDDNKLSESASLFIQEFENLSGTEAKDD